MKRLTISRLMDEYTDTEFFPTGGSTANPEAVKGWVLANAKAPAKKKRMPTKKKVLLASALAALMIVLVGAGFPYIQHQLVSGALIFEQTSDGRITGLVHYGSPVVAEEGRLFLKQNDGQRIDITDLISEETPYIYDGSNPDTNMTYYLIIGGTPDCCSFLEWISAPTPFDYSNDPAVSEDGTRIATVYSFECVTSEYGENHSFVGMSGFDMPVQVDDWADRSWLLTALNQLGIPFEYALDISGGSGNLPQ